MQRECSSGALLAAMAADVRIARGDTVVVLHPSGMEIPPGKRWTAADHAEAMRRQCARDRLMLSLLAERSGAAFDELVREASNEDPSSLSWCLAHGIVHAVEERFDECPAVTLDERRTLAGAEIAEVLG